MPYMRKYFQIMSALGIFGLLVLVRQHVGAETTAPVVSPNTQNAFAPTATDTPAPAATDTPVPTTAQQPVNQQPTLTPATPTPTPKPAGMYKDGTYTGGVADAFYGYIQVQAVVSGGRITDIIFLQYPNDNQTSQYINSQADPMLKQEALAVQNANVNVISGASASSQAFQQSLASALSQAK